MKVVPEQAQKRQPRGLADVIFILYRATAAAACRKIDLKDIVLDPSQSAQFNLSASHDILSQDIILLMDVPVDALDEAHWDAVERVAEVVGGSVILVAGQSNLPGESPKDYYSPGEQPKDYYRYISTATLLPFHAPFKAAWLTWPGDDPSFHFVPTPDAEAPELLKLPGENAPWGA